MALGSLMLSWRRTQADTQFPLSQYIPSYSASNRCASWQTEVWEFHRGAKKWHCEGILVIRSLLFDCTHPGQGLFSARRFRSLKARTNSFYPWAMRLINQRNNINTCTSLHSSATPLFHVQWPFLLLHYRRSFLFLNASINLLTYYVFWYFLPLPIKVRFMQVKDTTKCTFN